LYLAAQADAGLRTTTLARRLAAIAKVHASAGFESPAARRKAPLCDVWRGILRSCGMAQAGKAPLSPEVLRDMVATLPHGPAAQRDRALMLLGFAAALRRSELVALDWEDVRFVPEGLILSVRRSKTDPFGSGREIGIPYGSSPESCPVVALRAWQTSGGNASGPLFRSLDGRGRVTARRLSAQSVNLILKRHLSRLGADPSLMGSHSLRAGLVTAAALAGVPEWAIQRHTGHRSAAVLRRYIRIGSLFQENPAGRVSL
jgi:integrase